MDILIRRAESSDGEQLLNYIRQVGSESDNLLFGSEGLPLTVSEIQTLLTKIHQTSTSIWLVAEAGGELIGSAQLIGNTRSRTAHRATLAISVLKAYWHRGIASRLLQHLIEFAKQKDIQQIELEVRSDNAAAINLYRKFGFVRFGVLPHSFNIDSVYAAADYMYLSLKK